MSIIGVIVNKRQFEQLKKQIKEKIQAEIICINSKSIENITNIKFEIVVIQDLFKNLKEKQEDIKKILENTKYLLLNADLNIIRDFLKDINANIVTYGLKQKSTITASSIDEKKIIVSIQRAFKNLNGKIIEQQEIPVELIKNNTKEVYNSLVKTAIIKIQGNKSR